MVAVPTSVHANCGVYAIVFDNGKMYVGQASDINKRWREQMSASKRRVIAAKRALQEVEYGS